MCWGLRYHNKKCTRKQTLRLLTLALCWVGNYAGAADLRSDNPQLYAELRDATLAPLLEALHRGDVAAITHGCLTPNMFSCISMPFDSDARLINGLRE